LIHPFADHEDAAPLRAALMFMGIGAAAGEFRRSDFYCTQDFRPPDNESETL